MTEVATAEVPPKVEEAVQTKQIGFITKSEGMNLDEWLKREKEKYHPIELVFKDFPTYVEIHQVIPKKK